MEGSVYLKARQEWGERYADSVIGRRNVRSATPPASRCCGLLLSLGWSAAACPASRFLESFRDKRSGHAAWGESPRGRPDCRIAAENGTNAGKIRLGGVAERLKAPVLKTGSGESRSWVRIPPPPPEQGADRGPESPRVLPAGGGKQSAAAAAGRLQAERSSAFLATVWQPGRCSSGRRRGVKPRGSSDLR